MSGVSMDSVIEQLQAVLAEGFEGATGDWAYFTNYGPESGLLGTLAGLDAGQAARADRGSSITAHVHHLTLALAAATDWIQGDRSVHDWAASWRVGEIDEAAWTAMQERLREEYLRLHEAIRSGGADSPEAMGAALGQVAHVAYHLGMIRQKAAALGGLKTA